MAFLHRHPSTLALGLVSLLPAVCWTVLVGFCIFANQQQLDKSPADAQGGIQAKQLFLIFSLYWVWQFLSSVVHVTVAGAFASWYYFGSRATSVVLGSMRRALTSSVGSVSLGSLIVAILQFLRFLVNTSSESAECKCLGDMVLSCIEQVVRFFNKYAFCYVAIYGQSFYEGGRSVFDLFERQGLATLLNDDILTIILTMSMFIGGALGALVTGLAALAVFGTEAALPCALCGAIVSGDPLNPLTPLTPLTPSTPSTPYNLYDRTLAFVSGGLVYLRPPLSPYTSSVIAHTVALRCRHRLTSPYTPLHRPTHTLTGKRRPRFPRLADRRLVRRHALRLLR